MLPGVLKVNTQPERNIEPRGRGREQEDPEPWVSRSPRAESRLPPSVIQSSGVPQPCPSSGGWQCPRAQGEEPWESREALQCQLLWVLLCATARPRLHQAEALRSPQGTASEHRHPSVATAFCLTAQQLCTRNTSFPLFVSHTEPSAFSSHSPCFPVSPGLSLALSYLQR